MYTFTLYRKEWFMIATVILIKIKEKNTNTKTNSLRSNIFIHVKRGVSNCRSLDSLTVLKFCSVYYSGSVVYTEHREM